MKVVYVIAHWRIRSKKQFVKIKEKYGIDFLLRGFASKTLVQMTDTNTNETVWSDVFDFSRRSRNI